MRCYRWSQISLKSIQWFLIWIMLTDTHHTFMHSCTLCKDSVTRLIFVWMELFQKSANRVVHVWTEVFFLSVPYWVNLTVLSLEKFLEWVCHVQGLDLGRSVLLFHAVQGNLSRMTPQVHLHLQMGSLWLSCWSGKSMCITEHIHVKWSDIYSTKLIFCC